MPTFTLHPTEWNNNDSNQQQLNADNKKKNLHFD